MSNLSFEESKRVNRKTGLQYLDLSKKYKELIEKFENHRDNPIEGMNWNFDEFIEIYKELQRRTEVIGNRLLQTA